VPACWSRGRQASYIARPRLARQAMKPACSSRNAVPFDWSRSLAPEATCRHCPLCQYTSVSRSCHDRHPCGGGPHNSRSGGEPRGTHAGSADAQVLGDRRSPR
jgi:hypothetical protein